MKIKFVNFAPNEYWDWDVINDIVVLTKHYADVKHLDIIKMELENNSWSDVRNNRYDITITCRNTNDDENKTLTCQKLLFLQGMLVDGEDFHANFQKYCPGEEN